MKPIQKGDVLYGKISGKLWTVVSTSAKGFDVTSDAGGEASYLWYNQQHISFEHKDGSSIDWEASARLAKGETVLIARPQINDPAPQSAPAWRAWRDAVTRPGECPCGVPKAVCEYHRDTPAPVRALGPGVFEEY